MPFKKQKTLEKKISEIKIVNNKKLAPYIETVNFSYQNIDQRKLGTILGIFEIKDISEDSAYIVNFLASVAKKTYFANHHETALESFEATLYRLNLSLSEVAKHGNINWIGKIDAVLCSVNDSEIHFSVSGDAKVLLLRNNQLTEISAGLSPKDEAVNPIKTFTDIASGKLENDDKLIITTDDIFHVFTQIELEKHILSFTKKEFLRFLKTALINELDIAGTIVIDIDEKLVEVEKAKPKKKEIDEEEIIEQSINAFSNKTFEEVTLNKQAIIEASNKNDLKKEKNEHIHKKTGHIYIKDSKENYESNPKNNLEKFSFNCKESLSQFCFWIKDRYLKKGSYQIKKRFFLHISSKHTKKKIEKFLSTAFIITGNFLKKIIPEKSQNIDVKIENNYAKNKTNNLKKIKGVISKILSSKGNVSGIISSQKTKSFRKKTKITPNISKIFEAFSRMSQKNKFYALGIIAFIFIAPILIIKIQNKRNEIITEVNENKNHQEETSVNPSSNHYVEAEKIYFGENILGMITFGETIFIISKDKIIKSNNGKIKEYSFPHYAKEVQAFSLMKDLNLIFLINNDKKIISFSPISGKFNENNIDIPENANIGAIGTYLTYIYLIDSRNNQIYRYPIAENGFGERTNWLKEDLDLKNITSMAIDGNIFLIKDGIPVKLFENKKESFDLNKDGNSNIEELFTDDDSIFIYAIDKQNGEIIKFKKDGSLVTHHSNQNLLKANYLWTNENDEWSYFSTENEVFKIKTP